MSYMSNIYVCVYEKRNMRHVIKVKKKIMLLKENNNKMSYVSEVIYKKMGLEKKLMICLSYFCCYLICIVII